VEPSSVREFVESYRRLRLHEGFASSDPAFVRQLPFRDVTGRNRSLWRVRAFHYLLMRACLALKPGVQRVLDLGAGNGWLARRLAGAYLPTALDVDATDTGLGGLNDERVARVRAELESLPLRTGIFDAAVAAAALHYAVDLPRALGEVARVLRPGGLFVLADSPVYADTMARYRAWQRTVRYYADAATPQLAQRYRGITRAELDGSPLFHFVTVSPGITPWRIAANRLRGRESAARFPVMLGFKR
jgi:SAM-dependent methyltransferase